MQGLSSPGILSAASRKFLDDSFKHWQEQQKVILGDSIDAMKESVQAAIAQVTRDVHTLSNRCTAGHTSLEQRIEKIETQNQQKAAALRPRQGLSKASYAKFCSDVMCVDPLV